MRALAGGNKNAKMLYTDGKLMKISGSVDADHPTCRDACHSVWEGAVIRRRNDQLVCRGGEVRIKIRGAGGGVTSRRKVKTFMAPPINHNIHIQENYKSTIKLAKDVLNSRQTISAKVKHETVSADPTSGV